MFKLIVISPEKPVADEARVTAGLFENGLQYFHLRKPQFSLDEMRRFIAALPEWYHHRVVIHSHYALVDEFSLRGIHCTGAGREEFYRYEAVEVQKSISVHGFCEASAVDGSFAYAFLSPVFDSISKPGYQQGYLHDALADFLSRDLASEFIALGGVTTGNISVCKDLGFSGAAVLGSIWGGGDPVGTFKSFESIAKSM